MTNSRFWRASAPVLTFVDGIPSDSQNVEERLLKRLAVGHGVLAGEYSEESNRAQIAWIGAVVGVFSTEPHLTVLWRPADFTLTPSPNGAVYWKKYDWFNFSQSVVGGYKFGEIFAKAFADERWLDA